MTNHRKILAVVTALLLSLIGVEVASETTPVAAFSSSTCSYQDNGPTSERVACHSLGQPWSSVQVWLYCTNAPTVAVKGNRIYDYVDGAWKYSAAVCPAGSTKHHWTYAYWYY